MLPSTPRPRLRVDIVSDVVCPWCVVGYYQLARAAETEEADLDVDWHPFELNPRMPDAGEDLHEHLARKYGTTPAGTRGAHERLEALGAEVGFSFAFPDDMRIVPTFRAHQLLHWAGTLGKKHELQLALFERNFTHRESVHDVNVLAEAATSVGLDGAEARVVLADATFADIVREDERTWLERGVRGVPSMVFDGKHMVVASQGVASYGAILRRLLEMRADAARDEA